jgi:hypothetical protein
MLSTGLKRVQRPLACIALGAALGSGSSNCAVLAAAQTFREPECASIYARMIDIVADGNQSPDDCVAHSVAHGNQSPDDCVAHSVRVSCTALHARTDPHVSNSRRAGNLGQLARFAEPELTTVHWDTVPQSAY